MVDFGFFQQGIELRQNTKALELQAEELKNSVEQQRKQVGAILDAQKPIFGLTIARSEGTNFILVIRNSGQAANNITVKISLDDVEPIVSHISHMGAQSENHITVQEIDPAMSRVMGMRGEYFVCLIFEYGNGLRGEECFDFISDQFNPGGHFVNRKAMTPQMVQ